LNGTASVSHGSFAITSGGSYSVPPFGSASVLVSFTPFTTGVFNDELIFASNGGDSTNALAGSGAVAPTAGFTGSPTNGAASLLVSFADASTGTITNRSWTFGDGGTSTASSPSHNYTNAGTFSVNLTVFGPVGSNKLTRSNYITVTNLVVTVPVAGFTASPTNGSAPLLVSFADASTGSITNRSWTFGDGGISSANNPSHTYTNVGAFSVSLTVLGPGGSGVLTRTNYIMVTNVVNVAPVVSIVRPADGMVYPPLTNLAINIVANASDSDGISKIEFWDGTNKLGEASASPATNVLSAPAFGSHILAARAIDGLGMTNTSAVITITVGGKNSPLGDWEVTVSGKDKGLGFLTFSDDATASGYEIRLGTFGLDTLSGAWDFDAKSNLTGLFIEQLGGTTNWTGTLAGKAKSLKSVSASVTTSNGVYKWKGVPATTFPDLSGMWTGQVTVAKIAAGVGYAITTNATNAGVFDVAALTATNAVIGRFIVTSRGKMDGYITIASKQTILSGTFRASKSSVSLKGRNEDGVLVEVRIAKE
jgi:PKD repeat protein